MFKKAVLALEVFNRWNVKMTYADQVVQCVVSLQQCCYCSFSSPAGLQFSKPLVYKAFWDCKKKFL